jgi:hypothetical protein
MYTYFIYYDNGGAVLSLSDVDFYGIFRKLFLGGGVLGVR